MILPINGVRVALLGDVHLGRVFKNGVPLDRRGEREQMVRTQFHNELHNSESEILIQVGDLFDGFRVELNEVVFAADTIRDAAVFHPDRHFFFLAGNHDLAKDTDRISSLELVERLLSDLPNVHFVITVPLMWTNPDILMVPWSPVTPAADIIGNVLPSLQPDLIVGHWDRQEIAGEFNLIPLDKLAALTRRVVSGHDHTPAEFMHGDLEVTYVGSMQPYSHGEDPTGKLYVTRTVAEVEADPSLFHDLCLRILVGDKETPPTDVDCLQLTLKKIGSEDSDLTVDFEDGLNMAALFDECLEGIDADVVSTVKVKFNEVRNAAT